MATLANKRVRKKKGMSSIPWSDLPNELLELIKKRQCYIDQINFRPVCKSWSCIGEEEGVTNSIPPIPQMPWLLIYKCERYETYHGSWILIDPNYKKEYRVDTKSIQKKMNISNSNTFQCHESKNGWLLISSLENQKLNTTALFLYSPFLDENNNCIELPILSFRICFATFISNPLDEDCKVITLSNSGNNAIRINTYYRTYSAWTSQVCKCGDQFSVSDVKLWMYSTDEDIFYYVIRDGRVGTFDLAQEEWKVFPPLPTKMQATLRTLLLRTNEVTVYMMKSGEGELFLISECNLSSQKGSHWDYDSQYVYRLDLSSMIWKDLNSVGERVLFIGNGYNSILRRSSVLKTKVDRKGISNAIYCCSTWELKYCTIHDYTLRNSDNGHPRRQDHTRHYGHNFFITPNYSKLFIDPPLPRRPHW